MAFSISPSITINEIDAKTTIPAIYGQRAAIAGVFNWGPVGEPVLVSSESELASIFMPPTNQNAETFFVAANFLAYSAAGLYVNRADNGATKAEGTDFFQAKYPGAIGNSLGVSYVTSNGYTSEIASISEAVGTIAFGSKSTTISTSNDRFDSIKSGDVLRIGNDTVGYQNLTITSIVDLGQDANTMLYSFDVTFSKSYAVAEEDFSELKIERLWSYYGISGKSPSPGRLHIVVYDRLGEITGTIGTPIETFIDASLTPGAKSESNESIYYKDLVARSKWISATDNTIINTGVTNNIIMTGGVDGDSESTVAFSKIAVAYDPFRNAEEFNIAFILQGKAIGGERQAGLSNYIVGNIADVRKDCRAFLSPSKQASVEAITTQDKLNEIGAFRTAVNSSSYWHMDSGYKQQYDKYNDVMRWVPLNGDCAGLYSRVEPWESAAGYEKGMIKNLYKLALNPNKEHRDFLFARDINPVMTETSFGTLLFGDKTGVGTGSSFSRQNVRGLFIYLEKEIANASKILFFQFNDTFTQTRFKNMVEPKLRMVQGRRGLIDYRIVSDNTSNTADLVDSYTFNAKLFIKPAKTINYIILDFISTPTGIEFDEIIGQI